MWNFSNSYSKLPKLFFTKQFPTPVRAPKLIIFYTSLAASLGVPLQSEVFSGNVVPEGSEPLAQAYAGHQFGYFTMLGDGRALLLGEQITCSGERYDIQLKGSGRTPYSRGG
ncbi:MAG: protein adenylyltransferase SelO family protein, partial [Desulfovibrionaceae bacterium]|nr:protein adenylyltransferase SelO family protein [Desulfovibrionaceae bacterium]